MQIMSYHDFGAEPEKVYHALVLECLYGCPANTKSVPTVNPATDDMI